MFFFFTFLEYTKESLNSYLMITYTNIYIYIYVILYSQYSIKSPYIQGGGNRWLNQLTITNMLLIISLEKI